MLRSIAILLLLASSCLGQIDVSYTKAKSLVGVTQPRFVGDRVLVGDDSIPQVVSVAIIKVNTNYDGVDVQARRSLKENAKLVPLSDTEWLLAGEGTWIVEVVAFDVQARKAVRAPAMEITIGQSPGPGPGPDPIDPPGPGPTPDVKPPIPELGFRVLMVYESSEIPSMPVSQSKVLYSKLVSDYMTANCVKGPDGKTPDWRRLDQDTDMKNDSKMWQDAMARPRTALPWIVISNGKTGFEGPLPANEEDTLALLKKHRN